MYNETYEAGLVLIETPDGEVYFGEGYDPAEDPAVIEERLRQQMEDV